MPHDSDSRIPLEDGDKPNFRFFVFSCRDDRTDFRLPLVSALHDRQYETYYIWLRRKPRVRGPGATDQPKTISFFGLLRWLRQTARPSTQEAKTTNVYFNTTNAAFPITTALLRLVAPKGVWCMDMHDDLLYDYQGFKRFRVAVSLKILLAASDLIVRSADALKELFPRSHHLGNASHIGLLQRPTADYAKVLILASIDPRFDFTLMDAVARQCPDTAFHIYGQISRNDPATQSKLDNLLARNANVSHFGPYVLEDIERILGDYAVTFSPYRPNDLLTRYIDPLRYYHCLNSGMELISTPIPQARSMPNVIHLIETAEDFAKTLTALRTAPEARKNTGRNYHPHSWGEKAERLVSILRGFLQARG